MIPILSALDAISLYVRRAQWFAVFGSTYNVFAELVLMLRPGVVWDFCGAKSPPDIVIVDGECQVYVEKEELCKEPW